MNVQPIELATADGVLLRGQRWEGQGDWIILLHDDGLDLDCWLPLVPHLHRHSYTIVALDLRGHGASEGEGDEQALHYDAEAAIHYAQANGADRLFAVAAGHSASALLLENCARHLKAMVLLSPAVRSDAPSDTLRGAGVPKLLVIGSKGTAEESAKIIRNRAVGWQMTVRFATDEQGTALLAGAWSRHTQEHIVAFFAEQRHVRESRATPLRDSIRGV
jgi:pimeloyl-ACP methyl ester carboxylesterase